MKKYYGYGLLKNERIISISRLRDVIVHLMRYSEPAKLIGLSEGMYESHKKRLGGVGYRLGGTLQNEFALGN